MTEMTKSLPFDELNIFDPVLSNISSHTQISGADKNYRLFLALELYSRGKNVFYVCQNDFDAKNVLRELQKYVSAEQVLYYPKEPLYFTFADSYSRELVNARLSVLSRAMNGQSTIIVTSISALSEARIFPDDSHKLHYSLNDTANITELAKTLVEFGYSREERTEAPGQFSVRGGIIDLFTGIHASPIRIEFFGDDIDSVRTFDPTTQLSTGNLDSFEIFPFSDCILTEDERKGAIAAFKKEAETSISHIKNPQEKLTAREKLGELVEKLAESNENNKLIYMYTDRPRTSIFELFTDKIMLLCEPNQLKRSYEFAKKSVMNDFSMLKAAGLAAISQCDIFYSFDELWRKFGALPTVSMTISDSIDDLGYVGSRRFNAAAADVISYRGNLSAFMKLVPSLLQNEYSVVLTYADDSQREGLTRILETYNLHAGDFAPENICLMQAELFHGIDFALKKLLLVPYPLLVAKNAVQERTKKRKKKDTDAFFSDVAAGDYVVHETHGIGRYEGIQRITSDNVTRDYIKISYAKDDVLYVPTEQMDLIQKYIGANDSAPKLSRLGGSDWNATKNKVSGAVRELAKEYITMYALRQRAVGFAFSPDTSWQSEFEEKFPYEPTDDQIKATEEIKRDMERDSPMDRLLCGDVGYGKTEVAMRAAFKATLDSKQVAVLVPTTILALQHYNNFVERFKGYPIRIEMLSRFKTAKEKSKTIDNLQLGKTDIVIGTHSLLGKSVKFKNLGLLIVDEEQRFGVAHKDRLKLVKNNIDTLTLTATPIPRTLHMSLSGIRDMSVINQPPQDRIPVQTYVMEYDEPIVREAIASELARGGQVFYLHNRVASIDECADKIRALVPEARVVSAHGQMDENELERIIISFLNGEFDVLVATSIIENGIDIINANTMIIENADHLGLSQLYQLRGRVGRSSTAAYCYMLYRRDKQLSEIATKRLQSMKEFTKFGSGFKIAMRDLQIRGSGNLLGANQHGHFANVGYEMYCRLLSEAIAGEMGEAPPKKTETEIDITANAYIPESYIKSESQRIEIYKTIAGITDEESRDTVMQDIIDRYSDMPASVESLIDIAYLKAKAADCGIVKIRQNGKSVDLTYASADTFDAQRVSENAKKFRLSLKSNTDVPVVYAQMGERDDVVQFCTKLVKNLISK